MQQFWCDPSGVKALISRKFYVTLLPEEMDPNFDLRQNGISMSRLMSRVQQLTGIQITNRAMKVLKVEHFFVKRRREEEREKEKKGHFFKNKIQSISFSHIKIIYQKIKGVEKRIQNRGTRYPKSECSSERYEYYFNC